MAPLPQALRWLAARRAPLSAPPCGLPGVRADRAPRNGPSPGPRGDTLASASGPPLDPLLRTLALISRLPVSPLRRRPVPPDPDPSEGQQAEPDGAGRRSDPARSRVPRRPEPRRAPRVAARRVRSAASTSATAPDLSEGQQAEPDGAGRRALPRRSRASTRVDRARRRSPDLRSAPEDATCEAPRTPRVPSAGGAHRPPP